MSTRHRLGAIIAAGIIAVSLSSCSGGTPGAAAVVNGTSISEGEVDSVVEQMQPVYSDQIGRGSVALILANEPILTDLAADYGIAYSDSQLQDGYAATAEQADVTPVQLSDAALSFVRYQTIATALNNLSSEEQTAIVADYTQRATDQDLTLNPRYGEEISDGSYASTTWPWIVQTSASASQ